MSYRGINQSAPDTVELRRALRDLSRRTGGAGLGNRNLSGTVRTGNAPPILTGLSAFAQMRRIFLSWNDSPSADLARYEIQASTNAVFAGAQTFTTGNAHFTFDNATTGVTYFFRVRAVNISGNAGIFSNTVSVTPGGLSTVDVGASDVSPVALLQTQTIESAVGSVDFDSTAHFDSTAFHYFDLVWTNIIPDTNPTSQLLVRFKLNGAWKAGATDYSQVGFGFDEDGLTFTLFNATNSAIALNLGSGGDDWDAPSTNARKTGSGRLRIYPNYQGSMQVIGIFTHFYHDQDNDIILCNGSGAYIAGASDTFEGVRMLFTSANIATGRFSLYGYRNLS